jgi:hypothetical protein
MLLNQKAAVRSAVIGHEEGKGAVAKTSGAETDPESISRASQKMRAAGGSGEEVADARHESRKVEVGKDILDNNAVNLLMAASVSLGAMGVACAIWEVPLWSLIPL